MSEKLQKRRSRRVFLKTTALTAASTAVLAGGAIAVWLVRPSSQPPTAQLSCERVQALANDFAAAMLTPGVRAQIVQHVSQCGMCREQYRARGIAI